MTNNTNFYSSNFFKAVKASFSSRVCTAANRYSRNWLFSSFVLLGSSSKLIFLQTLKICIFNRLNWIRIETYFWIFTKSQTSRFSVEANFLLCKWVMDIIAINRLKLFYSHFSVKKCNASLFALSNSAWCFSTNLKNSVSIFLQMKKMSRFSLWW